MTTVDRAFLERLTLAAHGIALPIYDTTATCIHSSLALCDVLAVLGVEARPLRIEAHVFNLSLPGHVGRGCTLGWDGDGTRRPAAGPGGWHGHLGCVVSEVSNVTDFYLLDPTLPTAGFGAVPMCVEVDAAFLAGESWANHPTGDQGAEVHYRVYHRQQGWKSTPAARPSQRRELVERLLAWCDMQQPPA